MLLKNKNLFSLDFLQKTFLIFFVAIFLTLFFQNFLFSQYFELLLTRDGDNYAFSVVLNAVHQNIYNLNWPKLFFLNDYGYGWLFWAIHSLITYPFFLLNKLFSVDFFVIIVAREISLIFMFLTCFLIFKSIKIYTKNKYIPYFAVLLYMLYPWFGLSSLSFRTLAQGCFFCSLSFYLTIRKKSLEKNDLKYIAISLACGIATKISNALILPLIAIILLDRFSFKISKTNCKLAFIFLIRLVFFSIILSNPSLIYCVFVPDIFFNYVNTLKFHINFTKTSLSQSNDVINNFKNTIKFGYFSLIMMWLYVIMFITKIYYDLKNNKNNKFDFVYIFIFNILAFIYLCINIKIGWSYIAIYFLPLSFLIIFSLIFLEIFNKKQLKIFFVVILLLTLTTSYKSISEKHFEYFKLNNNEKIKNILISQKEIQDLIIINDKKITILADYRCPIIYSNIKYNNFLTYLYFDDINKAPQYDFDYIFMNKEGLLFKDDDLFKKELINIDESYINDWVESRKILNNIIQNNQFGDNRYQLIYDKNQLLLYKKL
jgi:hypothetical protein